MSILARSVREPSGNSPCAHALEQVEILFDRAIAVRALLAGLGQRAAILAHLLRAQIVDVRLARLDQLHRPRVQLVEVIGGVEHAVAPVGAQPARVGDDGVDVLLLFLLGIGVVEAQVGLPAELLGQPEVQANGLGVPDVQIAVGLGWKAGLHAPVVLVGLQIVEDDVANKVGWALGRLAGCRGGRFLIAGRCRHDCVASNHGVRARQRLQPKTLFYAFEGVRFTFRTPGPDAARLLRRVEQSLQPELSSRAQRGICCLPAAVATRRNSRSLVGLKPSS